MVYYGHASEYKIYCSTRACKLVVIHISRGTSHIKQLGSYHCGSSITL